MGDPESPNFLVFPDDLSYHDGKAVYISEHGAYHLATKCQLPIGEEFRDWLAEEVIPSIRKTGQYKLEKSFQKQLAIKDEQLEIKEQENVKLKEKLAVMTMSNKTKHTFQLYQCGDGYIFIRVQRRYLKKAIKAIDSDFNLILNEVDVPNSINILNKMKEKLINLNISFGAQKNRLTVTDVNILEMVEDMFQETWV